ncbi:MAG: hypothetical protein IH899_08235 [Planctomycetes bacterium]|nr:hypothetical protein [Planctomycetota bacterium]
MKTLNSKIAVFGACLLILGGLVGSVKAQPCKGLMFTGEITEVPGPLTGAFSVGDPFTVVYFFDPDFADTDPDPRKGEYFGAIKCFAVTVGNFEFESPSGRIEVRDDFTNAAGFTFDRYFGAATEVDGFSGPPILPDGTEGISCQVLFLDPTLAAFLNDSLPLDINCAAFTAPNSRFTLVTDGPAGVLAVTGRIDVCSSLGWGTLTLPGEEVDVELFDCVTGAALGVSLLGVTVLAGSPCPITCAVETDPVPLPGPFIPITTSIIVTGPPMSGGFFTVVLDSDVLLEALNVHWASRFDPDGSIQFLATTFTRSNGLVRISGRRPIANHLIVSRDEQKMTGQILTVLREEILVAVTRD